MTVNRRLPGQPDAVVASLEQPTRDRRDGERRGVDQAVAAFGGQRIDDLQPAAIAAWRMTIPVGHRFEATQALRQVLAPAVVWGLLDSNPAKRGVDNPQRRPGEMRPFEAWREIEALAAALGPSDGRMIVFAAATGMSLEARVAPRPTCAGTC